MVSEAQYRQKMHYSTLVGCQKAPMPSFNIDGLRCNGEGEHVSDASVLYSTVLYENCFVAPHTHPPHILHTSHQCSQCTVRAPKSVLDVCQECAACAPRVSRGRTAGVPGQWSPSFGPQKPFSPQSSPPARVRTAPVGMESTEGPAQRLSYNLAMAQQGRNARSTHTVRTQRRCGLSLFLPFLPFSPSARRSPAGPQAPQSCATTKERDAHILCIHEYYTPSAHMIQPRTGIKQVR